MFRSVCAMTLVCAILCSRAYAEPSIGIGPITNTYDYTSDSLAMYYFFRTQGQKSGERRPYVLVERPRDAEVVVTGTISSSFVTEFEAANFGIYMLLYIAGIIPGLIYLTTYPNDIIRYSHDVDLKFYKKGVLVEKLQSGVAGGNDSLGPGVTAGVVQNRTFDRAAAMEPLWRAIDARLTRLAGVDR